MKFASTILVLFFASSCGYIISDETYLIPDGMKGDVYVVRGVKSASQQVGISGVNFDVPTSGLVLTSFTSKSGLPYVAHYYYVKPDGSRLELPVESSSIQDTPENRTDDRPMIWFPRAGAATWTGLPCQVSYLQFYVGSRRSLLSRSPDNASAADKRFHDAVNENAAKVCEGKPAAIGNKTVNSGSGTVSTGD